MNLSEELDKIYSEATGLISSSVDEAELDRNKNEYLGKKGKLTSVLKNLASLSIEEKKRSVEKQMIFLGNWKSSSFRPARI